MRHRILGRTLAEPVHPRTQSAIRSARCEVSRASSTTSSSEAVR